LIVFLTFIQILIIRIQIRSGTGSGFVIKIYRSGFESRRPFILSPVFLTDTCVSYWHWHFLLTPVFLTDTGVPYWHRRFLLTQTAFLIDTGVSYWHQCFLLTPAFLTDTGVSCWHGVCYWHQRFLLTLAFLTDACVSYWRQGYLLTPVFFTDTGVSYWHRHFSYCRRRHTETRAAETGPQQHPAAPKPVAIPLWLLGQLPQSNPDL
jgi:hypothetical protein